MTEEARLEAVDSGLAPASEGWFVVNVRDAAWLRNDAFGTRCVFEADVPVVRSRPELEPNRFPELGFKLAVLAPGRPSTLYHAESGQEDFLVLAGECLLLVDGQERPLRQWDFVHCPAGTEHVIVGAGTGPALVLAAGARGEGKAIVYPVSELARRHGASAEQETTDPREAYAPVPQPSHGPAPALP
jgi:uncharacterized cupin superfamily protein